MIADEPSRSDGPRVRRHLIAVEIDQREAGADTVRRP